MPEKRFATEFREEPTDEPGLVLEDDGTVQLVAPGGSRSALTSNGGSQPLQTVTTHISSAEILDLQGNPVELIAAPGVDKGVILWSVVWRYRFGTAPYVGGSGLDVQTDPDGYGQNWGAIDILSKTQDFTAVAAPSGAPWWYATDGNWKSQRYVTFIGGLGGPATDGDGSLDVTCFYSVIDL